MKFMFMFTMSFSPQLSEKASHFSGAYVRKTFVYVVAQLRIICQALLVAHVLIRNQYAFPRYWWLMS